MIETSILIPTKNGAQDIDACLEAIFSQQGVGPLEVLVVDSGSPDATTEIARRYPVRLEQIAAVYGRQLPKAESGLERRSAFAAMYGESRIVKMPMDGVGLGHKYYHFSNANSAIRRSVWEVTRFPEDLKVFEDVGKFAAIQLGRNERILPRAVKKKLSLYGLFD